MKPPLHVILYGEKAKAAKLLGWAKRLLALDKKISMSGFVNRWLKTTAGDLVGLRSIRGVDTIIIRAIRKVFGRTTMEGSFHYWTMEACAAVDIWDNGVSGWMLKPLADITPSDVWQPFNVGHGDCSSQSAQMFDAGIGIDTTGLTITGVDLTIGAQFFDTGTQFRAKVWDVGGNVLATGTTVVTNNPSGGGGQTNCPINFVMTKLQTYWVGVEILVFPTFFRGPSAPDDGKPAIQKFQSGSWSTWKGFYDKVGGGSPVTGPFSTSAGLGSLTFDQAGFSHPSIGGGGGAGAGMPAGDSEIAIEYTPRPVQMFAMPFSRAVEYGTRDVSMLVSLNGTYNRLGTVYIFKWDLGGNYIDRVFHTFTEDVTHSFFDNDTSSSISICLAFDAQVITYTWSSFALSGGSGTILGGSLLVPGFKYTIGYLKSTKSVPVGASGVFSFFGTATGSPRSQRVDFDSWYGQKINTNSGARQTDNEVELKGMYMPRWTVDRVLLDLKMNGPDESTEFIDSSLISGTITANGNAKIDTSTDPFSDGLGSLLLDGIDSSLVFTNKGLNLAKNDFTIEFYMKTLVADGTILFGDPFLFTNNVGLVVFRFNVEGTSFSLSASSSLVTDDVWHYIVLVRSGDTWMLFIDKVRTQVKTSSLGILPSVGPIWVGESTGTGVGFFNGNIDNLEITEGRAKYTSDISFL